MRLPRFDSILLAAAAVLFVLLAYERSTIEQQRRPSISSAYDTGPNGYRALYEVLRTAGVPVRRFEAALGTLDPSIRTLVVTSYGFGEFGTPRPLDEGDAEILRDFVRNGGRLVAIDGQFAGVSDAAPVVGSTVLAAGRSAIAVSNNAYTAGVSSVRGRIDWIFPYNERRGLPLLANDHGIVAMWYRFGRGEVIAITAPALFSNEAIRNAGNLRFAYNVVANHGPAAFDEYVHGYADTATLWSVLPGPVHVAVWIAVAIVALALIGANVPFAPPYLPEPRDERTSSDYVRAVAELLRRSRSKPRDADVIRQAQVNFAQRKEHA